MAAGELENVVGSFWINTIHILNPTEFIMSSAISLDVGWDTSIFFFKDGHNSFVRVDVVRYEPSCCSFQVILKN